MTKKHGVLRVAGVAQAFQTYDATGDGSLNIEELRKALKALGMFKLLGIGEHGELDTPKVGW